MLGCGACTRIFRCFSAIPQESHQVELGSGLGARPDAAGGATPGGLSASAAVAPHPVQSTTGLTHAVALLDENEREEAQTTAPAASPSATAPFAGPREGPAHGPPTQQFAQAHHHHQQAVQRVNTQWQDVDELDPRIRIPFREITLHKVIGKGTFKTVYRGSWNNTHVAVVAMRRGGLVAEARLLQRLSIHPNLVQLYRWSTDNAGNEYLVMELLQLGSLDAVLRSIGRQLLTQTKMTIVEQLVSACVELSREGLVHGDLAARNLLVKSLEPPHIKLADFGLSRPAVAAVARTPSASPRGGAAPPATSAEAVSPTSAAAPSTAAASPVAAAGTSEPSLDHEPHTQQAQPPQPLSTSSFSDIVPARWAAPELLTGGPPSEAGDVWSFGVTCWEIFANGAEPYASLSNTQVLLALRSGYRLDRPRGCPLELWELILRCWAEDPAARPAFAAIAETLRAWREAYAQRRAAAVDTAPGGSAAIVATAATASGLPAAGGGGGSISAGGGSAAAEVASSAPLGGTRGWRPLTGGGGLDARRVLGGNGRAGRDLRPSSFAVGGVFLGGGNGASQRGSGSGGLGALVPSVGLGQVHGMGCTAGGAAGGAGPMSTHLSFDVADPPITPAYTSGSSIGAVSVGLPHDPPVGAALGAGLARFPSLDIHQGHSSRRTVGAGGAAAAGAASVTASALAAVPPPSPSRWRAATAGGVLAVGFGGPTVRTAAAAAAAAAIAATARALASSSQSSAPHTNSGNLRSSAGARSSTGTRSSAGAAAAAAAAFLDVRSDKPHRLQRTASVEAHLASSNSPGESGAAAAAAAAAAAPTGAGTSAMMVEAGGATGLERALLGGSASSGRAPSTITGASIFNDSVGPTTHSSPSGGDASGSGSTGLHNVAGGGPAAPLRGPMLAAAASAAAVSAATASAAAGPGPPSGLSEPGGGPRAGGSARASSPYIRIGELAAPPLPAAGMPWPTVRSPQPLGQPAGVAALSRAATAVAADAPGYPPSPYSTFAAVESADALLRAAGLTIPSGFAGPAAAGRPVSASPVVAAPSPTFGAQPQLLPEDLSLRAMVKVTLSAARSGTAGTTAELPSSVLGGGGGGGGGQIDSGTSAAQMSLMLPPGLVIMPGRRASDVFAPSHDDSSSSQQVTGSPLTGSYRAGVSCDGGVAFRLLEATAAAAAAAAPQRSTPQPRPAQPQSADEATEVSLAIDRREDFTPAPAARDDPALATQSDDIVSGGTTISGGTAASGHGSMIVASSGRAVVPHVAAALPGGASQRELAGPGGDLAVPGLAPGNSQDPQQRPLPEAQQPQPPDAHLQPPQQQQQLEQQQWHQLQQQQAQQLRLSLLLGTQRARRVSNGSRASASPRCGVPAAGGERSSAYAGSNPASNASSRGGIVPSRLLRTAPALVPPGPSGEDDARADRDAGVSPPISVRSARTPESLHSTWSVRSVWLEAARDLAPPDASGLGRGSLVAAQWQGGDGSGGGGGGGQEGASPRSGPSRAASPLRQSTHAAPGGALVIPAAVVATAAAAAVNTIAMSSSDLHALAAAAAAVGIPAAGASLRRLGRPGEAPPHMQQSGLQTPTGAVPYEEGLHHQINGSLPGGDPSTRSGGSGGLPPAGLLPTAAASALAAAAPPPPLPPPPGRAGARSAPSPGLLPPPALPPPPPLSPSSGDASAAAELFNPLHTRNTMHLLRELPGVAYENLQRPPPPRQAASLASPMLPPPPPLAQQRALLVSRGYGYGDLAGEVEAAEVVEAGAEAEPDAETTTGQYVVFRASPSGEQSVMFGGPLGIHGSSGAGGARQPPHSWGPRIEPGTLRRQGALAAARSAAARRLGGAGGSVGLMQFSAGAGTLPPAGGSGGLQWAGAELGSPPPPASLLRSSLDEVGAERQAIFDYLQTRQLEELQSQRDW